MVPGEGTGLHTTQQRELRSAALFLSSLSLARPLIFLCVSRRLSISTSDGTSRGLELTSRLYSATLAPSLPTTPTMAAHQQHNFPSGDTEKANYSYSDGGAPLNIRELL